jgi:hypothetical protein
MHASSGNRVHVYRTVKVRGEEIQTPNKPDTAAGTRDAMAKVCNVTCMYACTSLLHISLK